MSNPIDASAIFGGPKAASADNLFSPFPVVAAPVVAPVVAPTPAPVAEAAASATQAGFPSTPSPFPQTAAPVAAPVSAPSYPASPAPNFGAMPTATPTAVQNDRPYQAGNADFQFGKKVNRWPINRFKGIAERVQRVAILDLSAWNGARVHFVDRVKSFMYCFGGSCCKTEKPLTVNYYGPVVNYTASADGLQVMDAKFSVEFMSLSDEKYNNLLTIQNLLKSRNSSLDKVDLLVSGKNKSTPSGSFVDISFTEAGPAIWLQYPEFGKIIWAEYQRLKSFISSSFARSMGSTLEECEANYAKTFAKQQGQGGQPVQPAVNTVFNLASLANPNMPGGLK